MLPAEECLLDRCINSCALVCFCLVFQRSLRMFFQGCFEQILLSLITIIVSVPSSNLSVKAINSL